MILFLYERIYPKVLFHNVYRFIVEEMIKINQAYSQRQQSANTTKEHRTQHLYCHKFW